MEVWVSSLIVCCGDGGQFFISARECFVRIYRLRQPWISFRACPDDYHPGSQSIQIYWLDVHLNSCRRRNGRRPGHPCGEGALIQRVAGQTSKPDTTALARESIVRKCPDPVPTVSQTSQNGFNSRKPETICGVRVDDRRTVRSCSLGQFVILTLQQVHDQLRSGSASRCQNS